MRKCEFNVHVKAFGMRWLHQLLRPRPKEAEEEAEPIFSLKLTRWKLMRQLYVAPFLHCIIVTFGQVRCA
jgi:hypothetical protein